LPTRCVDPHLLVHAVNNTLQPALQFENGDVRRAACSYMHLCVQEVSLRSSSCPKVRCSRTSGPSTCTSRVNQSTNSRLSRCRSGLLSRYQPDGSIAAWPVHNVPNPGVHVKAMRRLQRRCWPPRVPLSVSLPAIRTLFHQQRTTCRTTAVSRHPTASTVGGRRFLCAQLTRFSCEAHKTASTERERTDVCVMA
jgi:hypothetical protein